MAIENRNLPVGTILKAIYKKAPYTCEVVATDDGLRYRYAGKDYTSPSAAGSAIMGGVACNGWRFWSLEGDPLPVTGNTPASASTRPKSKSSNVVKQIRRVANQKGVAEGSLKWFCSGCMSSFIVEGTEEPGTCAQGHPREAVDELAPHASETTS